MSLYNLAIYPLTRNLMRRQTPQLGKAENTEAAGAALEVRQTWVSTPSSVTWESDPEDEQSICPAGGSWVK